MRFKIHFVWPDGTEDDFVVSGDTLAECQKEAEHGLTGRGITSDELRRQAWSEEVQ